MEEIFALQRELAAVQQTKETLKLSERNVVDLVMKLQSLKLIDVIFTTNAKTILTPNELQKEILNEIQTHMGRVPLQDIHTNLHVDMSYIEMYVNVLIEKSIKNPIPTFGKLYILGGEILSDWYIDGIIQDTNEILHECGQISVGELAQQYGFSVDFMTRAIEARIDTLLQAQLKNNVLYTEAYVLRQLSQIRGIFSGITCPTYLPEIVTSSGFNEQLLNSTLLQLIETNEVHGVLRGREYIPHIYFEIQKDALFSFFTSNGFIPNIMATQLQLNGRLFDLMKKSFPDCIELGDYIVASSLLLELEIALENLRDETPWLDARSILPTALDMKNSCQLLSLAVSKSESTVRSMRLVQIGSIYVVNSSFFSDVLKNIQDQASKAAIDAANKSLRQKAVAMNVATGDPSGKTTKKGSSKKINQAQLHPPPRHVLVEMICDLYEHCSEETEFAEAVIVHLDKTIHDIYTTALTKAIGNIHRGNSHTKQELQENFELEFEEMYGPLILFKKGMAKMSIMAKENQEGIKWIESYLMETKGFDLCRLILEYLCEMNDLEMGMVGTIFNTQTIQEIQVFTEEHEEKLKKHLPNASVIIQLWNLAYHGELDPFLLYIPTVAESLNMPIRKLDRKKERAIIQRIKQTALDTFENETSIYQVLSALSASVFHALTNTIIHLPPNNSILMVYPSLACIFQNSLPPKAFQLLSQVHEYATNSSLVLPMDLLPTIKLLAQSKNSCEFL